MFESNKVSIFLQQESLQHMCMGIFSLFLILLPAFAYFSYNKQQCMIQAIKTLSITYIRQSHVRHLDEAAFQLAIEAYLIVVSFYFLQFAAKRAYYKQFEHAAEALKT